MKKNCCKKTCNYLFVYLPVVLLSALISIVYITYYFFYLKYLIQADPQGDQETFFLKATSNIKTARVKGLALFVLSLIFVFLLLLSMYRSAFCDPGYFPSPLELEYRILSYTGNNRPDNNPLPNLKDDFLSKFSSKLLEGPLTKTEAKEFRTTLEKNYADKMKENIMNTKYSNEEIMNKNKANYMLKNPPGSSSIFGSNPDCFLEIYNGVDLSKMTLCGSCLRLKVERSHHCRHCQKCVLKLDHHCPWIANCIGYKNLKYFILLQVYGILSCGIVLLSFWESVVNYNTDYHTNIGECWYAFSVYLINVGLLCFILWLSINTWTNLYNGMTTIEASERKRFPSSAKSVNIYNLGPKRNFTNVFGRNPLLWWLPFCPNFDGSGFIFETNEFKMR